VSRFGDLGGHCLNAVSAQGAVLANVSLAAWCRFDAAADPKSGQCGETGTAIAGPGIAEGRHR